MSSQADDPGREIALKALKGHLPGAMLEDVIRYAIDQLGWHRTDAQLLAFLASFTDPSA